MAGLGHARNSRTIFDAFQAIARYLYIHSPALELKVLPGPENVQFDFRITELSLPQLRQSYELSLANAKQVLHLLAGNKARPDLVSFFHRPVGPDKSYQEFFGCEVRFAQDWCGARINSALASQRIDHADSKALLYATKYLETWYPKGETALSARVTELIRRLLPTGLCNAQAISREMAMHPRTLQRRLAEEGLRYEDLLDHERQTQASRYLGESGLSMLQIAGLLGYSEQSTFSRSCQRWFGSTPRQYRERLLNGNE